MRLPEDLERVRRFLIAAVRRSCPAAIAAEADDVVQQALIKLSKTRIVSEENRGVPASYLWRVAYTTLIDEIRRRERRREVPLADDSPTVVPIAPHPDPEREAVSRGIGEEIRDCLQRMAEARRRAVTLHLVGHTVPEIARLLSWQPKQADNRVYRGMADLRRCLTTKGVTP